MKRKLLCIAIIILASFVLLIYITSEYIIITPKSFDCDKKFGIIDGDLLDEHQNIVDSNIEGEALTKQHGDFVMEFMETIEPEVSFYYYNAEVEGEISTNEIIDGLQWMIDSGVDNVAICLSGKRYSSKLENWILENSESIVIYVSYNNELNTFDYPANYEGTIGVGTIDVIAPKETDVLYKTSHILAITSKGIKIFNGNSYLTPYTMVKNNE